MKKFIVYLTLLISLFLFNIKSYGQCPTANFSYTQAPNGVVFFTNTSTNTDSNTVYTWSYGDSSINGSGTATSHTYQANGIYAVTLYATNNGTIFCTDSISIPITINSLPTCSLAANFSFVSGANGVVNFNATSTATIATYSWNFGDANFGSGSTSTHTYLANGSYTVSLFVTSGTCIDTVVKVIAVTSLTCSLTANFIYSQAINGLVSFTNTSTGTNSVTNFSWNFGDNTPPVVTASNTSHNYANGTYTVTLTASSSTSLCINLFSQVITVTSNIVPCNLAANFTHTTLPNGSVNFNNVTIGTTTNTTYYWNFGDGFANVSTTPTHTYSSSGAYNVLLLAKNDSLCVDTIIQVLNITGVNCLANANFSVVPTATALIWNAILVSPWNITAANWNWGDNSTSNILYASHTYSAPGTYSISLTVTVSCGGTSSTSVSSFIFNASAGNNNQMVQINVVAPSPITLDIAESMANNFTFTIYPNPNNGNFELKLNTIDNGQRKIFIYTMLGELIYQTEATLYELSKKIDLGSFPSGIYFITLTLNNKADTKKIIINH